MHSQRLVLVALLCGSVFALVAWLRPEEGHDRSGISREQFWTIKLGWSQEFDLVAAGDSRVLCDVSPRAMKDVAPLKKIANFGFNYAALNRDYLNGAVGRLNPRCHDRAIILGITPRSLTPLNQRVSGYREESERPLWRSMLNSHAGGFLASFRPFAIEGIAKQTSSKDFYADGWMAVRMNPPNPEADVPVYQSIFNGNAVSEGIVAELIATTQRWNQQGIRVFAFRPPVTAEMLSIENQHSGFREGAFSRRFTDAGGIWLTFDSRKYRVCDGSHLDAESAQVFSRDLAGKVMSSFKNAQ
jgi:hypothetical protein